MESNPIYRDKLFRMIGFAFIVLFLLSLAGSVVDASQNYGLDFFGGTASWDAAFAIYKWPLTIAGGLIATYTAFTSLHLLHVQNMQREDARKLNAFTMHFQQRSEFDNKFVNLLATWHGNLSWQFVKRLYEMNKEPYEVKYPGAELSENDIWGGKYSALRLYEFSHGAGRNIEISQAYRSLVNGLLELLERCEGPGNWDDPAKEQFIQAVDRVVQDSGLSFPSIATSEWFSQSERFSFGLAVLRLLIEVEIFNGDVRKEYHPGYSLFAGEMDHSIYRSPAVLKGEGHLSKGGREGRIPSVFSIVFKKNNPDATN